MELPGFYKLGVEERIQFLKDKLGIGNDDIRILKNGLTIEIANRMIENVIGTTQLPLGLATYFRINGREVLVPMAIEEPSVVAAASHAAKMCRPFGFQAEADEPIMIGLVQLVGIKDIEKAKNGILKGKELLKNVCNKKDSVLVCLGGGLKEIDTDIVDTDRGKMLVVKLYVNVCDAMGANAVNTMCEAAAPVLEDMTGGRAVLKIISNFAIRHLVRAKAVWPSKLLGNEVIEGILDAYALAKAYPYRAATNNKGIMNGVDAVLIATGNDWRAVEAGAHSYAAINGYKPLAHYEKDGEGNLVGRIELPMPVGIVGGATKTNPISRLALKILDIKNAKELAMVAACVGLANNFAAVCAIVKEGINRGHMRLHAKNIAVIAGAIDDGIDIVAKELIADGNISVSRAKEILKELGKS